jgi:Txe/YoeB family toxin of Txe-Axe toxin-antitoxin module
MKTFKKYNGLLFVGDPHLWSLSPGTRVDIDMSFADVVLDKISQAIDIALEHNLFLVFLGDLFDDDEEKDNLIMVKLMKLLKRLPEAPVTILGNHEKKEIKLTDDVALSVIKEAGLIDVIEKTEVYAKFEFKNGKSVYLGGTPYGMPIPVDVKPYFKKKDAEENQDVIWITHHDLAFGEDYPGAQHLREVQNCFMLINGHNHVTKEPMQIGVTKCYNPGNITRMTTADINHIPRVWQWLPENKDNLTSYDLKFNKNVFNLIHKNIQANKKYKEIKEADAYTMSRFVEMLHSQQTEEHDKTDDGTYLKENITSFSQAVGAEKSIETELLELLEEVLDEEKENKLI